MEQQKPRRSLRDHKSFIPVQLYISNSQQTLYNCCDEWINILISLKGQTEISTNHEKITLEDGGVLVLTPLCPIVSEHRRDTFLLALKLEPSYFDTFYEGFSKLEFKRNHAEGDEILKHLTANIVKISLHYNAELRLELEQYLLDLAALLYHHYRRTIDEENVQAHNHALEVVKYVKNHLKEPLTLPSIAAHVHLNEQYLSRYFSATMGMTLLEYIRMQRLYDSMNALRYTDDSIAAISENSGFANVKSYYKVFKEYFALTPRQYRKVCRQDVITITAEEAHYAKHSALEQLYSYIRPTETEDLNRNHLLSTVKYNLDVNQNQGSLRPVWRRILTFARACDGLRGELRSQLEMIQREIPFSYVRFHGIFSDDMGIYNEDAQGNVYYNFAHADELIDFLLRIKLRPYLELGFMPEQLASRKKYLFAWHANVSAPKDMKKWEELIENFLKHLISRYGIEEVSTWYFEIWNDPDFPHKFSNVPISEKFPMFHATYKAIKRTDPRLKAGGINNYEVLLSDGLIADYFKFFSKNNIRPDFISMSIYGLSYEAISNQTIKSVVRPENEDFVLPQNLVAMSKYAKRGHLSLILDNLSKWIDKNTDYKGELIINEWNLVPDPLNCINDTAFKAPYFIENILEASAKVDAIAYWTFSDIFDEVRYKNRLFHGGIGFLTETGLKKPVYYAIELLNMVSGNVIVKNKNILATKSENGTIYILLYNYCEFCSSEIIVDDSLFYDRYKAFHNKKENIQIILNGAKGEYQRNTYCINQNEGSVFDEWLRIGAPTVLRPAIMKQLECKSLYHFHTQNIRISGNETFYEVLEPHEVKLIQLIPQKYTNI